MNKDNRSDQYYQQLFNSRDNVLPYANLMFLKPSCLTIGVLSLGGFYTERVTQKLGGQRY